MRLGIRQLELLRFVGTGRLLLTHCRQSRRLVELGLLDEVKPGGPCHMAPKGLRALADAADAGKIKLWDDSSLRPTKEG